jgi:hypothetical protein
MTLDEAIRDIEQGIKHQGHRQIIIPIEAAQLGIEALRHVKTERICFPNTPWPKLPGETEE